MFVDNAHFFYLVQSLLSLFLCGTLSASSMASPPPFFSPACSSPPHLLVFLFPVPALTIFFRSFFLILILFILSILSLFF